MLYNKHREKIASDSYTPQTLKLQVGAILLVIAALIAMAFSGLGIYILALGIALLLASMLPFLVFAARRDIAVALAAPFIVVMRDVVFVLGLGYAFARGAWK